MRFLNLLSLHAAVVAAQSVRIPKATGPFNVGQAEYTLVDESRLDPYAPADEPHNRRILIATYVPIDENVTDCEPYIAEYMSPATAAAFGAQLEGLGLPADSVSDIWLELCDPVQPTECNRRFPLVIISPGLGSSRTLYGAMASWIASRGYSVMVIDHPYDAIIVEFPDGTITYGAFMNTSDPNQPVLGTHVRAQDMRFAIDWMRQHDDELLLKWVDSSKVIAIGHSLGGASSIQAIKEYDDILGGLNFDGTLWNTAANGTNRPAVIVGTVGHFDADVTYQTFWDGQEGPSTIIEVNGTQHLTFSDIPLLPELIGLEGEALEAFQAVGGTLDGARLEQVITGILLPFFDFLLNDDADGLRNIEDTVPEVSIIRSNL